MIKDNFKDEDIINWSKRGKSEVSFCFKQALGEAFFHGLDLVGSLETESLKLQKSLTSAKASADYYKGLLDGAEKKIKDIQTDHKKELQAIQDELNKARNEAQSAGEAKDREIEKMRVKNEKLQADKDMELSQAYSAGFAAYIHNFLAADPDYFHGQL